MNEIYSDKADFLQIYYEIKDRTLVEIDRCYMLYQWAKYARSLDGIAAEVGVFNGGTAKLIAKTLRNKKIFLFDTFEGIPESDINIDLHKKGEFASSYMDVQEWMADCKNVEIIKGIFPEPAKRQIYYHPYCFIHLDLDVYKSTLDSLNYFYDKLVRGGVLISDDYEWEGCPGVTKCINEFFEDKEEEVIITTKNQCLIIKKR